MRLGLPQELPFSALGATGGAELALENPLGDIAGLPGGKSPVALLAAGFGIRGLPGESLLPNLC